MTRTTTDTRVESLTVRRRRTGEKRRQRLHGSLRSPTDACFDAAIEVRNDTIETAPTVVVRSANRVGGAVVRGTCK